MYKIIERLTSIGHSPHIYYFCTKVYKGEQCKIQQHRIMTQKNLQHKKQKVRSKEGKKQNKIIDNSKTAGLKVEY